MKKTKKRINIKKNKKDVVIKDSKKENINKLIKLIGNAVGIGMGVGVIVLLILNELSTDNAIIMLGIGLFCVSLPAIMKRN